MKKLIYNLPSLIFNIAETVVIFLIGKMLRIPVYVIVGIMMIFFIIRMSTKSAKHYKDWYRCFIWSALVFSSLFVVAKVDLIISIFMTIFSAIVLSGKGDVKDCYMWHEKGKKTKYLDIEQYIEQNSRNNPKLSEFEEMLEKKDRLAYQLYTYRFLDGKTFSEMEELVNIDNRRITDKLNEVALSIRIFCNI